MRALNDFAYRNPDLKILHICIYTYLCIYIYVYTHIQLREPSTCPFLEISKEASFILEHGHGCHQTVNLFKY